MQIKIHPLTNTTKAKRKTTAITLTTILLISLCVTLFTVDSVTAATNITCYQTGSSYAMNNNGVITTNANAATILNTAITTVSNGGGGIVSVTDGTWILTTPLIPKNNVALISDKTVTFTQPTLTNLGSSHSLLLVH